MSQLTKVKIDKIGLYVSAGGYIARPFFGTSFKVKDEVKTHHFGGSIHAGVGLSTAKFRKIETFEYWVTAGSMYQKMYPKEWKLDGRKYKDWDIYLNQVTLWYYMDSTPAKIFAERHNRKYARSHKAKYRDWRNIQTKKCLLIKNIY